MLPVMSPFPWSSAPRAQSTAGRTGGGTVRALKDQGVFQKDLETWNNGSGTFLHADSMPGHDIRRYY